MTAKLTILRRDFFNENDTESQSGEIAKEIKVTGQKTAYESRASLDGKILFMVLAHPNYIDDLEKYIQEGQWENLLEYITFKFIDMIEDSSIRSARFNKYPLK